MKRVSSHPPSASQEWATAHALLRRFGHTAICSQTLAPGGHLDVDRSRASYAAYVLAGKSRVVAAEPIGEAAARDEHLIRLVRQAHAAGHRLTFFAAERRPPPEANLRALPIGRQPWLSPEAWSQTLRAVRSLREQLRRARARGVVVEHVLTSELKASQRQSLAGLIGRWQLSKPLPPMAFLVELNLLRDGVERDLFLAQRGDEIVGFAAASPIAEPEGWFVEHLIRAPGAPNGVSELLLHTLVERAAEQQLQAVSLGLAPLAGELPRPLRWARSWGRPLYDFPGLERFKAKFRPQRWQSVYLWYPEGQSPTLSIYDSLRAFAGGSLLKYAWRAALRGPTPLLQVLWILLVPWTLLLAASDAHAWFPWAWLKWFWVGYDLVTIALLILVSRGAGLRWLNPLLAMTSLDTALSLLSVVFYNAPRVRSFGEALVLLAGSLAPAFATLVLFGRRKRLLAMQTPAVSPTTD